MSKAQEKDAAAVGSVLVDKQHVCGLLDLVKLAIDVYQDGAVDWEILDSAKMAFDIAYRAIEREEEK